MLAFRIILLIALVISFLCGITDEDSNWSSKCLFVCSGLLFLLSFTI